jgi:hypothetical protein
VQPTPREVPALNPLEALNNLVYGRVYVVRNREVDDYLLSTRYLYLPQINIGGYTEGLAMVCSIINSLPPTTTFLVRVTRISERQFTWSLKTNDN